MSLKSRLVMLGVGLSLGLPVSMAWAADVAQPQAPWRTGVITGPDKKFSYCVSEAPYSSGLWLLMALNDGQELNLGIGEPKANLAVGSEKMSTVSVDGKATWQMRAKVTKPELMVLNGGKNPALMKALMAGSVLEIDGTAFALHKSAEALATLKMCVQTKGLPQAAVAENKPKVVAPTSPSSTPVPVPNGQVVFDDNVAHSASASLPSSPSPQPSRVVSPATKEATSVLPVPNDLRTAAPVAGSVLTASGALEASSPAKVLPDALKSLLSKAGVTAQPAPRPAGAAYAWTTNTGLSGFVREQVLPSGSELSLIIRNQIAAEAALCNGKFRSENGTAKVAQTSTVQSLITVCDGRVNGFVYALNAPQGADAVLSVIQHKGSENGRVSALTLALTKALGG